MSNLIDMRGIGGEDGGVLLLEGKEHGELPVRGVTGDHGVVGGLGMSVGGLQVGVHGDDAGQVDSGELEGVVVTWSSQLHMTNLR